MNHIDRRILATAGLALGIVLGAGCPGDDGGVQDTDPATTTGPSLCGGGQVTCPDGTCHAPAPGVCCGFGGLCPNNDDTAADPTNITTPTTTIPPTSTLPTNPTDPTNPTNPTNPTTDVTVTDSTTDESTTSTTTGDESTSTGMTGPEGCYDPLIYPYDGALCGPAGNPCVVQDSETIEPMAVARNGEPAISVDDDCAPAVLLSQSVGGALGFFAQRTGVDTWDVQGTPFPLVQGGLDYDPATDFWYAAVYEGGFDTSARIYDGMWNAGDPLVGNFSLTTKSTGATGDDQLHAIVSEPGVGLSVTGWDAGWAAAAPVGGANDLGASLAVAEDGSYWFTYWAQGAPDPVLRFLNDSGVNETVTPYGAAAVSNAIIQEITLTSAGGTPEPHVLAGTETGPDGRVQVQYLRRDGADMWNSFVVASEDPTGETFCEDQPMGPGEFCTLDFTTYRPLTIVSSQNGDVRWLFSETHALVEFASECTPDCAWTPLADNSTYTTHLGWLEGGVPQQVAILPDTRLVRANAIVDGLGDIHVVAYADAIPDTVDSGLTVEYFRIAP